MRLSNTSIAVLCLLVGTGIAVSQAQNTPGMLKGMNSTQTAPVNGKALAQDGKIIAFIEAIDNHEIAAANEVSKKNISPNVLAFAEEMKKEHTKNLNETIALSRTLNIPQNQTSEVTSFKAKGQAELHSLAALNNHRLNVAYVKAMVDGHTKALALVTDFAQEVNNPALKEHVIKTRDMIAKHLEHAKKLYADLKKIK